MLFHTINSTALPLDSEHALQLVLGQATRYRPTADEECAASPALHLTRLLKTQVDVFPVPHQQRLGDTPATVLHSAAKAMIDADCNLGQDRQALQAFAEQLCAALIDILARLPLAHPDFCKAKFFVELAALAWDEAKAIDPPDERINAAVRTLEEMGRWLGQDGFCQIEAKRSLAQQLLDIYTKVRARVPKRIFLSRWYPNDTDGDEKRKARLRKEMIDRTLNDLRQQGINFDLDDPGTLTGGTFLIPREMYDAIERNDIILIDLSGVRPNVCIEAGYALERPNSNRLLFLFQPTEATQNNPEYTRPPFDLAAYRYERIADAAEIPEKLKPHLEQIYRAAANAV